MISTDLLTEVHELFHCIQIWNRLISRFNVTGLSRVMELKGFLSHLQKGETQSMEDYLRSIKVAMDQLASIGAPISELELINNTLGGLDLAYD